MNLDRKKEIVEELHEKFEKTKIVILTDYKGLDVSSISDLRKKLRASDVEYRVVKNSLLKRAAEGTDAIKIAESFKGPSAIALSYDDPVAPAGVLTKFADENKKLEIKIGVLGEKVLSPEDIKALSALPSKEVLLAQVLAGMNAVPTGLVSALSDLPRKLLNVLQALKEKKDDA